MGQAQSNVAVPTPSASPPQTTAQSCPVDHTSREAWLKLAQQQGAQTTPTHIAQDQFNETDTDSAASACPVDPKARSAWLKAAQAPQASQPPPHVSPPDVTNPSPPSSDSNARPHLTQFRPKITNSRLSTDREISTIPRALPQTPTATQSTTASAPLSPPSLAHGTISPSANAQTPTGDIHTSSTGHWVYPSESMFFAAMARKNYSPRAADMSSVVPIHNAVNERTWREVLKWERGQGAELCGGPKLVSFAGDASKLTPRARWKMLLGYQAPFDRHDWVVDRCGKKVEYVIDFYEGKKEGEREGGVSFYLDVRPKLNSWEGLRMRVARYWGWS